MGMTAQKLLGDGCNDITEVETPFFTRYLSVEHNLKEKISQLLLKVSVILTLYCIDHLVNLFQGIRG